MRFVCLSRQINKNANTNILIHLYVNCLIPLWNVYWQLWYIIHMSWIEGASDNKFDRTRPNFV